MCKSMEANWVCGTVVRECLEEVHIAIDNGDILVVEFAWEKYLLQWTRSGPGFYGKRQWTHKSASKR